MAFNFGALLTGVNRGLSGYRQGQMAGEDQRAKQDAAEKAALFAEYAKRRQMDQEDAALKQRESAAQALAGYRDEQNNLRRDVADMGTWMQRATAGQGGTVDRTNQTSKDIQAMPPRKQTLFTNNNGEFIYVRDGDEVPAGFRPWTPPPRTTTSGAGSGIVTNAQRQAAAQYELAKPAHDRLRERFDAGWAPSKRDKFGESIKAGLMPDVIGNMVQSDEGQQTYDDLTALILASQYALSGKAVTENEARRLARGLMPQLGDKPDRASQKKKEIDTRLRVIMASGGATEGITDAPPPRLGAKGGARNPRNPY